MDVSTIIARGLDIVSNYGLPLLSALAGVGVVSMAILQVVKDLTPIQARFNARRVREWLARSAAGKCEGQLLALASAGDEVAFYELPTAGLTAQISMASRVALAYPASYEELLHALSGRAGHDDVALILHQARDAAEGASRPAAAGDTQSEQRERERKQFELDRARTRVAHLIERNIDALQIRIASRWERANKIAASVTCWTVTVLAFAVYFYVNATERPATTSGYVNLTLTTFAVAALAGFVAPVAKDLVTALQRLKGGR